MGRPAIANPGTVYEGFDAVIQTLLDAYIADKGSPERLLQTFSFKFDQSNQSGESDATMHMPGMRHPLKHPKDIRVLELHAGSFEDELHCILHVCSLGFDLPPCY